MSESWGLTEEGVVCEETTLGSLAFSATSRPRSGFPRTIRFARFVSQMGSGYMKTWASFSAITVEREPLELEGGPDVVGGTGSLQAVLAS